MKADLFKALAPPAPVRVRELLAVTRRLLSRNLPQGQVLLAALADVDAPALAGADRASA